MNKIEKYDNFLLEREFDAIINDIFKIVESNETDGEWKNGSLEWDFAKNPKGGADEIINLTGDKKILKNRLEHFLQKLPKEKIKKYYNKLIDKLQSLPEVKRKQLIVFITTIFLSFVSYDYLASTFDSDQNKNKISTASFIKTKHTQKVSFELAQYLVKNIESGYSNDRRDRGNYYNGKFIGTNHGISAPLLAEYLDRTPTPKDMKNLSYKTATKIFKENFWDKQNLDNFTNQSIANIIYDGCINQGVPTMRSILRDALESNNIKISDDDNIFSIEIIEKANSIEPSKLFESIKKYREKRYKESQTYNVHGEGWMNRLDNLVYIPSNINKNQA